MLAKLIDDDREMGIDHISLYRQIEKEKLWKT